MANQTQRATEGDQPQRATDSNDFLEGIDEQFHRLMKLSSTRKNGRSNGNAQASADDPLLIEIFNHIQSLTRRDKELVLSYVRSLKQKAE